MNKMESLEYKEILEICFNYYKREYSDQKFNSIKEKVLNNNKTIRFLSNQKKTLGLPWPLLFLQTANSIPYFLLSKQITTVIASLIIFQKWVEITEEFFDEGTYQDIVLTILKESNMINYIY